MTLTRQTSKPLRIVLVCNYKPDGQFSMLRYAEMQERLMRGAGHDVVRVSPPVVFGRMGWLPPGLGKWARYIDKYVLGLAWLRWKCRSGDVVHVCDHSNAMYLWCAGRKPRLVTCHDLLAVRSAQGNIAGVEVGLAGRVLQRWILSSLRRAEYVVCDSMNTEADLVACGSRASVLKVIYLSLNREYAPVGREAVERTLVRFRLPANCRYLMHIGANGWYKNRLGAMQIFSRLKRLPQFAELKLIMAGTPWSDDLRDFRSSQGLEDSIIETGIVNDDELCALYSGAVALLFPSLQEGFGWPILEAQACGCPVITTNRRPMTEVAGDAAILLDDPTDIDRAARTIVENWSQLPTLREMGFRNLSRFSGAAVAAAYDSAYQEVLELFGISREGTRARA